MSYRVLIGFICLALTAAVTVGCEADEYSGAPSAKAPANSQVSSAPASVKAPGGLGPVSGTELPPGHPPIGEMGQGGAAIAGLPAAGEAANEVDTSKYGKVGPIRWEAPAGWKAVAPGNQMRLAQYMVPGPDGAEAGELTIFHFGPGGGGGVDDNLDRWAAQVTGGEPARRGKKTVNGLTVHTVDASGSFDAGMGGESPAKANQRVLGAIAEAPSGLFFFKLVGPATTLAGQESAFEQFVDSLKAGDS